MTNKPFDKTQGRPKEIEELRGIIGIESDVYVPAFRKTVVEEVLSWHNQACQAKIKEMVGEMYVYAGDRKATNGYNKALSDLLAALKEKK